MYPGTLLVNAGKSHGRHLHLPWKAPGTGGSSEQSARPQGADASEVTEGSKGNKRRGSLLRHGGWGGVSTEGFLEEAS